MRPGCPAVNLDTTLQARPITLFLWYDVKFVTLAGALVLPDGYLAFNRSFIPFISNIDCPYGNESVIDCELGGEGGGQCQPVQIRCDG